MKRQVFVIHGGNAFEKCEEYLERLKTKDISLEKLRSRGWKMQLGEKLGDDFDVLNPQMPNQQNARYLEWKIWFERLVPLMATEVILVGHSLGGLFLAKYLSENKLPHRILGVFLVAAPYNTPTQHPKVDFIITEKLDLFAKQAGKIFLYHSTDDTIVPYSNALEYQKALPSATLRTFDDRVHFNGEDFPELEEDIRVLN